MPWSGHCVGIGCGATGGNCNGGGDPGGGDTGRDVFGDGGGDGTSIIDESSIGGVRHGHGLASSDSTCAMPSKSDS